MKTTRTLILLAVPAALCSLLLAGCASNDTPDADPAPDLTAVDVAWETTADSLTAADRVKINCPSNGPLTASVWGGDDGVYTGDSAVCVAAVHAGKITPRDGGLVVLEMVAGRDSYAGSEANGVITADWDSAWDSAFIFP